MVRDEEKYEGRAIESVRNRERGVFVFFLRRRRRRQASAGAVSPAANEMELDEAEIFLELTPPTRIPRAPAISFDTNRLIASH